MFSSRLVFTEQEKKISNWIIEMYIVMYYYYIPQPTCVPA